MPRYPIYPSQPNTGRVPSMVQMGPPDLRPTSSTGPYYAARLNNMHGRYLAGLGSSESPMEPEYALNELRVLAEMDDVQGDGIFDPPNTQKNVHPGAGVFSVNYSLPGMHAREVPFGFSEEIDITTGRPIRAVPSGAVANDSAAQIAFLEGGLYKRPQAQVGLATRHARRVSTVNVMQNAVPLSETVADQNPGMRTLSVLLLGLGALGLVYMARKDASR
jgi:hypothetical protein